jgi:RNA 3'-terminal phosphate cyclase-like protein
LTGVTDDATDPSVEVIRMVTTDVISKFGAKDDPLNISVRIKKRGPAPIGGGEVLVHVPQVKSLRPISLMDVGKVKRVGGLAWSSGAVPKNLVNGLIEGAKGVLLNLLPNISIHTDHHSGKGAGPSVKAERRQGKAQSRL